MKFEDFLLRTAARFPDKAAVVCAGKEITYGRLGEMICKRAEDLHSQGFGPGKAKAFRASQTIDFLIEYFAVHLSGGVSVPLEGSIPESRFRKISSFAEKIDVPEGTADILFTTGTTGKGKGVMISHEAIMANTENLVDAHGYSQGLVFIVGGPLNHIGSLSKVFPTLLSGGTLHMTDGMKDLKAFFKAFDYPCGKFASFLVPASLRMMLSLCADELERHAGAIDFIETGAAPMALADMERLCRILPGSRLYNTYASTETGIICTYDYNSGECIAGCLGRPMKHSKVFITEDGTIACSGKTLMSGYAGDEELTRSVMRGGVLYTHDNGMIDSCGRLHLSGRADDVINVGGYKVSPVEIEDAALSSPDVKDCVCVPVSHPVTGSALKLLVVPADGKDLDKRGMARYLASRIEAYKIPLFYEKTDCVRRTYNGKIDRKHYRKG